MQVRKSIAARIGLMRHERPPPKKTRDKRPGRFPLPKEKVSYFLVATKIKSSNGLRMRFLSSDEVTARLGSYGRWQTADCQEADELTAIKPEPLSGELH